MDDDYDTDDYDDDSSETLPCPNCGAEIYEDAERDQEVSIAQRLRGMF